MHADQTSVTHSHCRGRYAQDMPADPAPEERRALNSASQALGWLLQVSHSAFAPSGLLRLAHSTSRSSNYIAFGAGGFPG